MSQANGPDGLTESQSSEAPSKPCTSMECELFESLIHHLIEKGVLTWNDALSVVGTVAEVKVGMIEEADDARHLNAQLRVLKRLYANFEMMPDRSIARQGVESSNVTVLRPPIHGDHPEFPEN